MLRLLVDWFIKHATKRPHPDGHLHHADGTRYMGRWELLRTRWLWVRLHHICTPDLDRHMHDHPWSFVSLVLRGWYVEARPEQFATMFDLDGRERSYEVTRLPGSLAHRYATDRHRIVRVSPGGVWTLFITGPWQQSWGFYTELGKIHHKKYQSVHATTGGDRA